MRWTCTLWNKMFHVAIFNCIITPNGLSPTKKQKELLQSSYRSNLCGSTFINLFAGCNLLLLCFSRKHPPHGKLGFSETWRETTVQSNLLLIKVCRVNTLPVLLWLACCSNAQEPLTVSLFCMLTRFPERRSLSCGTMWPDRTHSSSLTFLCAHNQGRALFMLHCFHIKQCYVSSQPLGDWDLFSLTVLWFREYCPRPPGWVCARRKRQKEQDPYAWKALFMEMITS